MSTIISNNNISNNNLLHRYIILPNNPTLNIIENKTPQKQTKNKTWNQNNYKLFKNSYEDYKNDNTHIKSDAGVYTVQCLDCNLKKIRHEINPKTNLQTLDRLEKRRRKMQWSGII